MTIQGILWFLGILVAYGTTFMGLILWMLKHRRNGRKPPFPQDTRIFRRPGQHLEEQIVDLDDRLLNQFMVNFLVPLIIGVTLLLGLPWVSRENLPLVLSLIVLAVGVSVVMRAKTLVELAQHRQELKLGLFGEQVVADALSPLAAKGYGLYHDVPAVGGRWIL